MRQSVAAVGVLILLGCFPRPPCANAQSVSQPPWEQVSRNGPRERRALREKAVETAGPESRAFVEAYGEDAVAAIFACSSAGIQKLIEFHASGGLGRLPQPRDLLKAVARPKQGDEVIAWAADHEAELSDPDSLQAFINAPLEYALGLKRLSEGAEELRAARTNSQPRTAPSDSQLVARGAGLFAVIGLLIWWGRRRRRR